MTSNLFLKTLMKVVIIFSSILFSVLFSLITFYSILAYASETQVAKEIAPKSGFYTPAGDVEIFTQTAGNPVNPPILMIHGMGSWSELWRGTMEELANNGYYAIAIDLPPFGFSDRPDPNRLNSSDQAKRISAVIQSLNLNKVHLVGHSFGGGATLHTALLIPEKIRSIHLVDVAISIDREESQQTKEGILNWFFDLIWIRNRIFNATITNPHLTSTLFSLFVKDSQCVTNEKIQILQQPLKIKDTTNYLANWLNLFIFKPNDQLAVDLKLKMNELKMPIFFIWGEADTVTPLKRGIYLQSQFPYSKLQTMPGIGHIPQLEDETKFNAILIRNLNDVHP